VVSCSQRVQVRTQKGQNAALLVLLEVNPEEGGRAHTGEREDQKRSPPHSRKEQNGEGNAEHQKRRAQVRFFHDQQGRDRDEHEGLPQFPEPEFIDVASVIEKLGQADDQCDLDQLRGLKGNSAEAQPALGSGASIPDESDQHKKPEREKIDRIGQTLQEVIIKSGHEEHDPDPQKKPVDLFQENLGAARPLEGISGAVEIEHTHEADEDEQEEQYPVKILE